MIAIYTSSTVFFSPFCFLANQPYFLAGIFFAAGKGVIEVGNVLGAILNGRSGWCCSPPSHLQCTEKTGGAVKWIGQNRTINWVILFLQHIILGFSVNQ